MKKALEGVATGIGKEIGKRIELATVDTAGPATQCVQAFLGPRYGATIARIVATGTGREYGVDPVKGSAQVSTGQVLVEGTSSLAGTVVLLVRRQLVQHGLAHRPAGGRLHPRPPGLDGRRRRRPGPDRQGHLGLPPRRAADHRHRDEVQGDQGQGARGARQVGQRADRRQHQGDQRPDGGPGGRDLARVPPRARQGRGAGRPRRRCSSASSTR